MTADLWRYHPRIVLCPQQLAGYSATAVDILRILMTRCTVLVSTLNLSATTLCVTFQRLGCSNSYPRDGMDELNPTRARDGESAGSQSANYRRAYQEMPISVAFAGSKTFVYMSRNKPRKPVLYLKAVYSFATRCIRLIHSRDRLIEQAKIERDFREKFPAIVVSSIRRRDFGTTAPCFR